MGEISTKKRSFLHFANSMHKITFFILISSIFAGLNCRPNLNYPIKIGIMRLGKLDDVFFAQAKKEIELFYNASVIDLGEKPLPKIAYYSPRNRFRANKLIKWLRETSPDSIDYILGITSSDISITKGEIQDYGIMGLAYNPGRSGVVSTFRLSKGAKNQSHVLERFSKTVLHELGHNFGIEHCSHSKHCLMRDACGTVKTLDAEAKNVCGTCKRRLGELLK